MYKCRRCHKREQVLIKGTACDECKRKQRESVKLLKEKRRAAGKCLKCGGAKDAGVNGDYVRCGACRKKVVETVKKRRAAKRNERVQRLVAAGEVKTQKTFGEVYGKQIADIYSGKDGGGGGAGDGSSFTIDADAGEDGSDTGQAKTSAELKRERQRRWREDVKYPTTRQGRALRRVIGVINEECGVKKKPPWNKGKSFGAT